MSNLGVWYTSLQFLGSVFAKGTPTSYQSSSFVPAEAAAGE